MSSRSRKANPSTSTSKTNMHLGGNETPRGSSGGAKSRRKTAKVPIMELTSRRKAIRAVEALHSILKVATSIEALFIPALAIAGSIFATGKLHASLLRIGIGYIFILRPLLTTLRVMTNFKSAKMDTKIIAFAFSASILCNQFPAWLSALVASCSVFAFGLASRQLAHQSKRKKADEIFEPASPAEPTKDAPSTAGGATTIAKKWSSLTLRERAGFGTIAVVGSLLLENFLIWVVSATYEPGISGSPEPLQDNGRTLIEMLVSEVFDVSQPWMAKRRLQTLRDALNVQWAIVSGLGASFICLELQLGKHNSHRTLAGLALHALMTLASARLIRTVSFGLTVLPSQVPNCYARHFPPPPDNWRDWLMVGFLPNSRGGCNDLILSGHATVTSSIGCAFTSVASDTSFSIAVWTLIALDYSIETYQGLHYSVDMWLGCIVTCLLWHLTKGLEVPGDAERIRSAKNRGSDAIQTHDETQLNTGVLVRYALPPAIGFVILAAVPEAIRNYFLVGYTAAAGVILFTSGFTNYVQHILLCLLYVTLGTYL
mmetsp:Transcript_33692/g.75703  ORF Transcript_33692/g.75703 Transcript_33692/m.75703 type:complete len:543 (+) Transcript_33692:270-1898(+)